MYKIIFYKDRRGRVPVKEYLQELTRQNTKDSLIRSFKIRSYMKVLSEQGFALVTVMCKHIEGDLWELRPSKDRIFFAGYDNGVFIMLHCFEKKTQKTPKREIERAKREFKDFLERRRSDNG